MASVSGVSSSNSSSIYGSRNVLSGLATGMDTESMIENAVSGYQQKITSLQQKQTSLTWKQEAMRNVSTPMIKFAQKYTSYSSSTNLLSSSFFNKAVSTTTGGTYADKISATGKTSSDVQILAVKQLASKSTYNVSASTLGGGTAANSAAAIGTGTLDLAGKMTLSNVSGTLDLKYGTNRTISISFDEIDDIYGDVDAFVKGINDKLANTQVSNTSGDMVAASTMIKAAKDDDGNIVFTDNQSAGNTVTVFSATGNIKDTLGIDGSAKSSTLTVKDKTLSEEKSTAEYLANGKSFSMTVDGKTKTISLPTDASTYESTDSFIAALNKQVQAAFGTGVEVSTATVDGKTTLQFTGQKGSTLSVNATSAVGTAMGLGGATATSYLNTGKTLGDLLDLTSVDDGETLGGIKGTALKSTDFSYNKTLEKWYDTDGNWVDESGNRLGSDGKQLYGYTFEMNGKAMTFTRDTAMESILTAINADTDIGVSANFSKTTNMLQLTAQETGASNQIVIDDTLSDGTTQNLAALLFGTVNDSTVTDGEAAAAADTGTYAAGQDAVISMSVNGVGYADVKRSDNSFEVDGLSITLKGTFAEDKEVVDDSGKVTAEGKANAVTFTTAADADKIVSAITDMVKDLNEMLKSVHDAYSTLPNYKSNNTRYDPLTDDDKADMSDSAIESYEEKAKQGILFGDSDLSSLYSKLLSAISPGGASSTKLSAMGITTSYSEGITSLSIDEDALRTALGNDPDSVRDAFTGTTGTNGLMVNVSKVVSDYAATTGSTKGILVQKAGSVYSSMSLLSNEWQDKIDDYDDQISTWQDKLSDKIDYYTEMFTRLETLTSEMNSQSSMLSSMMGG